MAQHVVHLVREASGTARPSRPEIEDWLICCGWQRCGAVAYADPGSDAGLRAIPSDDPRVPLSFAVPLPAPDVVGIEAEAVIAAARVALGLAAEGDFLPEWRLRNASAHRRAASGGEALRSLPRSTHTAVWRWNQARDAYFDRLSAVEMAPCAPPTVRLFAPLHDRVTALTAVTWCDAAPIALPEVDLVLAADGPDSVPRAIPLVALMPWLERFPRREAGYRFGRSGVVHDAGLAHWIVDYDIPPEDLLDALRTLGAVRQLVPVPACEVLDREGLDIPKVPRSPTRLPLHSFP